VRLPSQFVLGQTLKKLSRDWSLNLKLRKKFFGDEDGDFRSCENK